MVRVFYEETEFEVPVTEGEVVEVYVGVGFYVFQETLGFAWDCVFEGQLEVVWLVA